MTPPGWGKTMSEDKPAIYIMKNVDGRLWYWEGKNDRPEEHMLEALSEESLDNAIVAIRAHIAEMGETTNPKPTKLLVQPGLLKELGYTVEDVVKMIKAWPKVVRLPTAQQDLMTEPYAWQAVGGTIWNHKTSEDDRPLYAKPFEWQGLTDEEIEEFENMELGTHDLCLEIEAKLQEKNA